MITKTAIAAHVALLKKQAAMVAPTAAATAPVGGDPNDPLAAAKAEATQKKELAGIAVERSNADLATKKAASTIQQNEAAKNELMAKAQPQDPAGGAPQPMPGPGGQIGPAPTTPGMPQAPAPTTMPAAAPATTPGNWMAQKAGVR